MSAAISPYDGLHAFSKGAFGSECSHCGNPEAHERHSVRGLSLEDAIKEFVRIQNRYDELREEKNRVLEILVPAAMEARGETKTARLANHNRSVVLKAEFGSSISCDTDLLNEVKEMLGDDVFEELFKTEYAPKQRGLKPFLATKTTDERIETAKGKIAMALKISPTPPRISIEKGGDLGGR